MTMAVRPLLPRDERFVVSAWVMSLRDSDYAGLVDYEDWHRVMRPVVAKLLKRPDVTTLVAYKTDEDDPTADLYGFLVAMPDPLHPVVAYCYVKHAYRRFGIARTMFAAMGIDPSKPFRYVCRTPAVAELIEARKIPSARWDPMPVRIAPRKNAA